MGIYQFTSTEIVTPVNLDCAGLGDALMVAGALSLAHSRNPNQRYEVWTKQYHECLLGLPCIVAVHGGDAPPGALPLNACEPYPPDSPTRGRAEHAYHTVGLGDVDISERRMVYVLYPADRDLGYEKLAEVGWDGITPVVGVQMQGGWTSKMWAHTLDFAQKAQDAGYFAVIVGKSAMQGCGKALDGKGVPFLTGLRDSRQLAGVQSHMRLWMGFESGGSFQASALGIPTLWISATHNPEFLIGRAGANAPYKIIWPNWVKECSLTGRTCRSDLFPRIPGDNGKVCPKRPWGGADCLDSISAEAAWKEAVGLFAASRNFKWVQPDYTKEIEMIKRTSSNHKYEARQTTNFIPGKASASWGRIFDCFTFYDEFDLLEIRLTELSDAVDFFVICEGDFDFRGRKKPLMLLEYLMTPEGDARFGKWIPQIRHVTAANMPIQYPDLSSSEVWSNEGSQRNALAVALDDCVNTDLIMVSDVDEIPRCTAVQSIPRDGRAWRLNLDLYHYNFNGWDKEHHHYENGVCAISYNAFTTACDLRSCNWDNGNINDAGWHFSWFGGKTKIDQKVSWYSHPLPGITAWADGRLLAPTSGTALNFMSDVNRLPCAVQQDPLRYAQHFDETFLRGLEESIQKESIQKGGGKP